MSKETNDKLLARLKQIKDKISRREISVESAIYSMADIQITLLSRIVEQEKMDSMDIPDYRDGRTQG